jgi:CMP-N-acetylneuraminic acid synthetase
MKPLCVIPARGGSKRLPRKNLAALDGRPLIAWTIEAARLSGIFDRIYLSTEDEEIATVAAACGADTGIRRPLELAGDEVTNVVVALHLCEALAGTGGRYDAIVCLQPSSPLRDGADIAAAWRQFEESGRDFLASATPVDPHDCHWALERRADGTYGMVFGDRFLTVRQRLPEFLRPDGAIKIARLEALRQRQNFFGPSLDIYRIEETHATSIGTRRDLVICEALVKWQRENCSTSPGGPPSSRLVAAASAR